MSPVLVVSLAAAVLGLAARLVFVRLHLKWFRQGAAGDAAFHLAITRQIGIGEPYRGVPEFLLCEEPDAYPIMFHRFAALFPRTNDDHPYVPNLIIWTIFCGLIAAYAEYAGSLFGFHPYSVGPAFAVAFLTLASNLGTDSNGINYFSLSERLLARCSTAFFFVALAVGMESGDNVSLLAAAAAGALALTTSLFSRQALFFTVPLVALLTPSALPVFVLAAAMLGALIIDRGYFLHGLRQQMNYSMAYQAYTKRSRYYVSGLSKFIDWKKIIRRGRDIGPRLHELETSEPTRLVMRYPEIAAVYGICLFSWQFTWGAFHATALATLLVYVATTFERWRHFGEANRYVEYNLWIIMPLLLALQIAGGLAPIWLLTVYAGIVVALSVRKFLVWRRQQFPNEDHLAKFLTSCRADHRDIVFPVPVPLGAAIFVRSQSKAVVYQGVAVSRGLYARFLQEPPFLNREWMPIAEHFGCTLIVADKSLLGILDQIMGWTYDFSGLKVRAESERYVCFEI